MGKFRDSNYVIVNMKMDVNKEFSNIGSIITLFCSQSPVIRPGCFYCMNNSWQDAGIRTQIAATADRCATNQ